jgi:ribosomal protein S10
MPDRKIDGVELDAAQYNRLLTIYGKELPSKQEILNVMRMPGFDLLNLDDQQKYVQRTHSRFIDIARKQLTQEDPMLSAKIAEMSEARKAQGLFYKPD